MGEHEADGSGDVLLAGARARTAQAVRIAARAAALTQEAEPWTSEVGAPDGPSPRWSVSWRVAVVAAILLVAMGAVVVLRSHAMAPPVLVSTAQASISRGAVPDAASSAAGVVDPAADPSAPTGASAVTVHVVGAVAAPGVVSLPPGARAVDAVQAAGGATSVADLERVNLARVLSDGEQVLVPAVGEAGSLGGAGVSADGVLDLNAADAAALDGLPRIGPVLAGRIVAWRTAHGRFSSVDELGEVPGIGPALLAGLAGLVRV